MGVGQRLIKKPYGAEQLPFEHHGAAVNRITLQKTAQIVKVARKYHGRIELGQL
ncbi:hypothetical protein D3C75_1061440 [compost metagenome]